MRKPTPIVCSWSGGKDCCLALDRAVRGGAEARYLLTMLHEAGERSRSHGLTPAVLSAQAASLGIPHRARATTWDDYEAVFTAALAELAPTVDAAVFGDIDLVPHREWEERVCRAAGIGAQLPLWQADRRELLAEFFARGYRALIVCLAADKLDKKYLGAELTPAVIAEFGRLGIDPCGEFGEYHTVVFDGPLFTTPVTLRPQGEVLIGGCWALDLAAG